MNIKTHTPAPRAIATPERKEAVTLGEKKEESSFLDKVVTGAQVAGLSAIPGLGGYGVLRPIAFQVGLSGSEAYRVMDAATLMNYASVPLLASSVVFPKTGLIGAGICLGTSMAAGLYGAAKIGMFD